MSVSVNTQPSKALLGRVDSLKQRAYAELKQQILSGLLLPGTLLSERQLATALKMSKTPVHAALERLEADGLITVAPQLGIMVREVSPREIADHFEFREAVETFVVQRLAGRLTLDQIKRLNANLSDHRRAARTGDVERNMRLDAEFHLLLCEFLGNVEITRVMTQLREKVLCVIRQITSRFPARLEASHREHRAIVEALIDGDPLLAVQSMRDHLHTGLQSIYQRSGSETGVRK